MLCFLRFFTRFIPSLRVMVAEFCSLWQQKYVIQRFCLPHSSTFLCLVCVTLPSFSSISLYVPSFCRSLSTFVLARFCRYCRSSSRVTAVFLCLALFVLLSVLLAVICARPLPFFSVPFCFIFQQSQKACYMFNLSLIHI